MKTGLIYKYTNIINGKVYIGQTIHNKKHREGHDMVRYEKCPLFYAAILKYGKENFIYEIVEDNIPQKQLNEREQYWVLYYHSYIKDPECNGYNLTTGGDTPIGITVSDARKEKVSQALMGHEVSQSTREKISKSKIGKRKGIKPKNFNEALEKAHEACSKKILDTETGIIYSSKAAAAKAFGFSTSWIRKRIGGKFVEITDND